MALEVKHLSGGYGQAPVLHDVNFTVPDQSVTALVGLNGSGKSTTIKHIIGLLTPKTGTITLNGADLVSDTFEYKRQIAYIPEQPVLYQELTLREHIELMIRIYQLPAAESWREAERLLDRFRLANKLDWFPIYFSKGMRQKVMIVLAFMAKAPFYIIDEPFLGLDVLAVEDLLTLIDERRAAGSSVLLTTHVLENIISHAQHYVYLAKGQVAKQGPARDLATLEMSRD